MTRSLRRYKPFLKAGSIGALAYKFEIAVWLIITTLEVLSIVFLWLAVYKASADATGKDFWTIVVNGFTFKEIIVYMVFANIFSFVTFSSDTSWQVREDVSKGNIAISFTQPISYRFRLMFISLGVTFSHVLIVGLPLITIAYAVFVGIGFITISNVGIMLFGIFAFLALQLFSCLLFDAIGFFFGVVCFYTTSGWGIIMVKNSLLAFLGGSVIPLSFFKFGSGEGAVDLSKVFNMLPFAGLTQNPIQMLIMKYNSEIFANFYMAGLHYIGFSLVWWIVFELINKGFFMVASRKVTVLGG